jgi:hypothetical protein
VERGELKAAVDFTSYTEKSAVDAEKAIMNTPASSAEPAGRGDRARETSRPALYCRAKQGARNHLGTNLHQSCARENRVGVLVTANSLAVGRLLRVPTRFPAGAKPVFSPARRGALSIRTNT